MKTVFRIKVPIAYILWELESNTILKFNRIIEANHLK